MQLDLVTHICCSVSGGTKQASIMQYYIQFYRQWQLIPISDLLYIRDITRLEAGPTGEGQNYMGNLGYQLCYSLRCENPYCYWPSSKGYRNITTPPSTPLDGLFTPTKPHYINFPSRPFFMPSDPHIVFLFRRCKPGKFLRCNQGVYISIGSIHL